MRVSKKTKRATGFCRRVIGKSGPYDSPKYGPAEVDCVRDEAYRLSEDMLETVRKEKFKYRPTRTNAVFFTPQEYDEDTYCGMDEYGLKECDFGYGKDTVVSVDSCSIPCQAGAGDTEKSDAVFSHYLDLVEAGADTHLDDARARELAEEFWKDTSDYNPTSDLDYKYEVPEVWAPCKIPRAELRIETQPAKRPRWAK